MADISKELDKKVKLMGLSNTLGDMIVTSKKLRDQLSKKDKQKAAAGLKSGGRAGLEIGGPAQQARGKKKKIQRFPGDFKNFTESKAVSYTHLRAHET